MMTCLWMRWWCALLLCGGMIIGDVVLAGQTASQAQQSGRRLRKRRRGKRRGKRVAAKPQRRRRRRRGARQPGMTARENVPCFSKTICKFYDEDQLQRRVNANKNEVVWEWKGDAFNELIASWNALRPEQGYIVIWVSVFHNGWRPYHRLAQWGTRDNGHAIQQTFMNKLNPVVHTKHCRVELQRGLLAHGFRIKAIGHNGATIDCLKALFGCISRTNHQKIVVPDRQLPSTMLKTGVIGISQMKINDPRCKDMCSPTSTAMMVSYHHQRFFGGRPASSMVQYAHTFAKNVRDQGYLNIFGNWILNTAHAFHELKGKVFFSVQRLNSFYHLHDHLNKHKTPVVVSVRRLPGGATPYANGHLLMVVGFDSVTRRVVCLDPAFAHHKATLKSYPLVPFLQAWGRSNNLSYVPLLKDAVMERLDLQDVQASSELVVKNLTFTPEPLAPTTRFLPSELVDQLV